MRVRYWQARSHTERSEPLDEMEAVTELHRKSLIRLINGEIKIILISQDIMDQ